MSQFQPRPVSPPEPEPESQPGSRPAPIVQKSLRPLPEPVAGAVITVSDRCAAGQREDVSGPLAARLLAEHDVIVEAVRVVPDGAEPVREAVREAVAAGARVVLTTGGTGITPRDLTPEGTAPLLAARMEGLEAQIRAHGLTKTPLAGLSRGLVGVTGRDDAGALVVNAPGSRGGVEDTVAVIGPLVPHVLEQLRGGDH
ncbi:MogA/MoaB family molybdenum cofactor biosynthesis protein [Actinomyces gerencseriae]|uniref:MogA/MoaB family molybdenum cofactor biosynthesis protein n=1 Tax=Actinomyces gerencseriae TaxID=52769 RepID=UPI0004173F3A|nr:MogA/MoaB family molybdenum cofactor biosynthesis protein [Actinomyces gerencseriae]